MSLEYAALNRDPDLSGTITRKMSRDSFKSTALRETLLVWDKDIDHTLPGKKEIYSVPSLISMVIEYARRR